MAGIGRNEPSKIKSPVISIDILPDDVLLAVFDIILGEHGNVDRILDLWQPLVHVCRRWRSIVFGSPGHLNLRLRCTARKPVRDMLDIWPPFPLIIYGGTSKTEAYDNVIAALERRDRVHEISLIMTNSPAHEKVLAAMQEPFPELTELQVSLYGEPELIIPDSFLGGSAPRLEVLELEGIPFPGLPNLLLSATNLYHLKLLYIPPSGYILPDAVVTAISTLTSLRSLILEFQPPRSHPYHASRRLPPKTRTVLPALEFFWFKGVHEYLDDLVAHIDAPRLHDLTITFFNDIVFDTPQFTQFINRTPKFESRKSVQVVIEDDAAEVKFSSHPSDDELLEVGISCRELDWQISFLEQVSTWYLPPLSTTEDLYMYERLYKQKLDWQDENMLWLELLHQFNTVKNLYLSKKFGPRIVAALQDLVGSRTTEVLPILQNIFLEELEPAGHAQEDIRRFVAARQLSGHTITVSHWERDRRLYS